MRIVTSFTGYSNWKGNKHNQVSQHHRFNYCHNEGGKERVKISIVLVLETCTIYMHVYDQRELDQGLCSYPSAYIHSVWMYFMRTTALSSGWMHVSGPSQESLKASSDAPSFGSIQYSPTRRDHH